MYTNPAPLAATVDALRNGQHSLSLYLEQMNKRITQVNPQVEALLVEPERITRLRNDAAALRERYPDPTTRPPLYGALVGVKDIFHVDGFTTRAGSQIPPAFFAGAEAICVQQLRAAGAVILGKTVTTEFAYFEPGPTHNPHNWEHTPGGSSSGSAAAVAAGLCPLALGTQTIGSVIRPAAFCGIVGFKPSFDRIATQGILYFSRTVDHVGLFTQDVAGMRLAAAVLCRDWHDDLSGSTELNKATLSPVLGAPEGSYLDQTEPDALVEFKRQTYQLAEAGYQIKRVPTFAGIAQLNQLHRRLCFAEFAQEHTTLYAQFAPLYRPRTREALEIGKTVSEAELADYRANPLKLRNELHAKMDEAGIDLWVCPAATGPAPVGIQATGDPNMNLPWTHAGLPAVTVPAGRATNGLPLGLQLIGRFGTDEVLLRQAEAIETVLRQA